MYKVLIDYIGTSMHNMMIIIIAIYSAILIPDISYSFEGLILDKYPELLQWSVRTGHPRLLITQDNKQEIINRVKKYYRAEFQDMLDIGYENFNEEFDEWEQESSWDVSGREKLRNIIEIYGFIYQMGDMSDEFNYHGYTYVDYGKQGVRALMAMKPEKDWNVWNTISNHRVRARYTGLALGYDWLYDLLTEEQKRITIDKMIKNCHFAFYPDDYQPSDATGIGNFPRCKENIAGFAFFGDGINDYAAKVIIDQLYTNSRTGLLSGGALDLLRVVCGDGITIDGMLYMSMHKGYIPFLEAWRTATGQDYFKLSEFYVNLPLWIAYSIQPGSDYSLFRMQDMRAPSRLGDRHYKWNASSLFSGLIGPLSNSNIDMARLSKWIVEELIDGYVYEKLIYKIIMGGDPSITPTSPEELNLPKARWFNRHGWVSIRSDWEHPDATFVTFMCHTYQFSRIGRFSNSFTIWKNRGPLLHNRGWGDHDKAFGDYTDAWNSFLFINPSLEGYDKNGRQCQLSSSTPEGYDAHYFLPGNDDKFKTGGIKYFETKSGKYSYVCGDAAKAYLYRWRRPYKDEDRVLNIFTRQFVYFPGDSSPAPVSDYFVIFDRVETKHIETEKHMLLQMCYEPVVIKYNWDDDNAMYGDKVSDGKWQYDNPHCFIITNTGYNGAHGKAFVKTLLPENTIVYKIGGAGHQFNDWYGEDPENSTSKEKLTDEEKFYWGEYRLHIVPAEQKKYDLFLHTIEATDISRDIPAKMDKIYGDNVVGARIDKWIALFNINEAFLYDGSAILPYEGRFNIFIADMEPQRQYYVSIGQKTNTVVASDAGVVFLEDVEIDNNTIVIGTTTLDVDNIPPGRIDDIQVATVTSTSVMLTWTAPGDDGMTGRATGYDARYNTVPITMNNWDTCIRFYPGMPKYAGELEQYTVVGLTPDTTYYFSIRACDERNNWSELPEDNVIITTLKKEEDVDKEKKLLCDFGRRGSQEPDGRIDFEDLMWFTVYWNAYQKDRTDPYGLKADIAGPRETTKGKPPDLITQPDNKVDFEDLMVFTLMWNWWHAQKRI